MALNLSTLTSPATSGDVLAEALTTADFLEGVPVLRNLARGSQKGGDAEQSVALNQPKALPLIDGDGYLYLSGVSGNYARLNATIPIDSAWEIEYSGTYFDTGDKSSLFGDSGNQDKSLEYRPSDHTLHFYFGGTSNGVNAARDIGVLDPLSDRDDFTFKFIWDGNDTLEVYHNGALLTSKTISSPAAFNAGFLFIGQRAGSDPQPCLGCVKTFKIVGSAISDVDVDFTATNVRHGDTKFKCATGQVVTINQSGNDPATIIKKSVLRFDGVNDGFKGLFDQTIDGGYMFAAFSVIGNGGESSGRLFGVNPTGGEDYADGFIFAFNSNLKHTSYYSGAMLSQISMFDDDRKDILSEVRIESGNHSGRVNNSGFLTSGTTGNKSGNEFNICQNEDNARAGGENPSIDLEFLALFPASITDAQADSVRNYINNRNNVFDLKDGFGYYFYDAQKAPVGAITTGSASWNGRIVGSDNGDSDKFATQGTTNDAPVGDGYVVTFADNTDHLEIPQVTQAGWQIVGTSLGTFAYRVNANAVTELNLLGNAGSHRSVGDSFGMLLLPESATGADIEQARKLLIDRGAADGATASSYNNGWFQRFDITEFNAVDFTGATNFGNAWRNCYGLLSFNAPALPSATDVSLAWNYCLALTDFRTTEIPNCTDFSYAWQNCSSLQSFPAGAKLGTSAQNVDFTSAFQSSGLTSFSTPLPTATSVNTAWRFCSNLTSFNSDLSSVTDVRSAWRATGLTSFSTPIPKAANVFIAFFDCTALTDFSADVFSNWNPSSLASGVFHLTWNGCTSLTAQSVENILTSIDASGHYATTNKVSDGPALADAGIDIDYNVATGSLSAATNTAVTSLKAKGWVIVVNGVTL